MKDPPRPEVSKAIQTCQQAGIRVFMITGDNKLTAEAVARDIHIIESDQEECSFTGFEFEKLIQNREKAIEILKKYGGKVFSRTEPRHKR
jgi:Ca2+-transporting ATPase